MISSCACTSESLDKLAEPPGVDSVHLWRRRGGAAVACAGDVVTDSRLGGGPPWLRGELADGVQLRGGGRGRGAVDSGRRWMILVLLLDGMWGEAVLKVFVRLVVRH